MFDFIKIRPTMLKIKHTDGQMDITTTSCVHFMHGAHKRINFTMNFIKCNLGSHLKLLTLWCRVFIEKLIVAHLVKKFPAFMECEGSQQPATG